MLSVFHDAALFCTLMAGVSGEVMPFDDSNVLIQRQVTAPQGNTSAWTSVRHNLTFIHIPRTGGTAVEGVRGRSEKVLRAPVRMWGVGDVDHQHGLAAIPNKTGMERKCFLQHHPANLNPKAFLESDTFCVLRDPVGRMISQYGFEASMFGHPCNKGALNKYFMEALLEVEENPYAKDCHLLPQSAYIFSWDPAVAGIDKSKGQACTNVLRYETLQTDFDNLMTDYGYPLRWETKKTGISTNSECAKFTIADFDPDVMKMARTLYADDFSLYKSM